MGEGWGDEPQIPSTRAGSGPEAASEHKICQCKNSWGALPPEASARLWPLLAPRPPGLKK